MRTSAQQPSSTHPVHVVASTSSQSASSRTLFCYGVPILSCMHALSWSVAPWCYYASSSVPSFVNPCTYVPSTRIRGCTCTCAHTQGITTLVNSQLLSVYRSVLYHVRLVSLWVGASARSSSGSVCGFLLSPSFLVVCTYYMYI